MAVQMRRGVSWIWVLLLAGLSILAWVSTYTGIMELISASSGEIGVAARIAVAFAVFMLQLMTLYLLDSLFARAYDRQGRRALKLNWPLRVLYTAGYIVLFVIAVGFAFGFYWKYLEAGSVTTANATATVNRVQEDLQLGQSRLEQVQSTLAGLALVSADKATKEREVGRTCPSSGPGDGPRRRLRDSDAERFRFANDLIAGRTGEIKTDIAALNGDLAKIVQNDPSISDPVTGSRNVFISDLNRRLGLTTTRFNALRTEPQLRQLRDEFALRAGQTSFSDDRGGRFSCPDPQLTSALNGVVRAIDELPELPKPELRAYEGSEAVIEAFRRLTVSGIVWVKQLGNVPQALLAATGLVQPPAPVEKAEQGLTDRDLIPLMISIFVDLCILLVSINRPFGPLFELSEGRRTARDSDMIDFLTDHWRVFQNDFDMSRTPAPSELISPLADVVFDHQGKYYAAVPLDFRETDFREWVGEGNIEDGSGGFVGRPIERSRYISAAFVDLEKPGFVQLVDADAELKIPSTDETGQLVRRTPTQLIQDKLLQQGSLYGKARAFRLYKFGSNQWADILQSSVSSGAARSERTAVRQANAERKAAERAAGGRFRLGGPRPAPVLPAPPAEQNQGPLRAVDEAAYRRRLDFKSGTAEPDEIVDVNDENPLDDNDYNDVLPRRR